MNREDVIRLAEQAGCGWAMVGKEPVLTGVELLERFAALVAAAEREECAKAVENYAGAWDDEGYAIAQAIRARGSELVPSNIMSSHKKVL